MAKYAVQNFTVNNSKFMIGGFISALISFLILHFPGRGIGLIVQDAQRRYTGT